MSESAVGVASATVADPTGRT